MVTINGLNENLHIAWDRNQRVISFLQGAANFRWRELA